MDDRENQKHPAEEEEPELGEKDANLPEHGNVAATEEDNEVEGPAEQGLVDEDPGKSLEEVEASEYTYRPTAEELRLQYGADPGIALALAEARKAEAELQMRRLEIEERRDARKAEQASQEAENEAQFRRDQLRIAQEGEFDRQQVEVRKAEAAQARERQKQQFELRKNAWSTEKMRGLVSILLVLGFLATTGVVIFLNATGQAEASLLQTVASLYSGITGAVLGFYFGSRQQ